MTHPRITRWEDLPPELLDHLLMDTSMGTCDWGNCNRPTAGWAKGRDTLDDTIDDTWITICQHHLDAGGDTCFEIAHSIAWINLDPLPGTLIASTKRLGMLIRRIATTIRTEAQGYADRHRTAKR